MIYDCFPFYNELDLLEIRLEELSGIVDRWVIAEAPFTHSGKPKPLYFRNNQARFARFLDRITHLVVTDFPPADFPKLGESWKYERHQRDALARGLSGCSDGDIVITSDVDEIPRPDVVSLYRPEMGLVGLNQSMHTYWLNCVNRETEYAWCKMLPFGLAKGMTHCQIRYAKTDVLQDGGWHFSFMGGVREVVDKIEAWAHQEYNLKQLKDERVIQRNMEAGIDPHERAIRYHVEPLDSTYPWYVLKNRERFRHLIHPSPHPKVENHDLRTVEWNRYVWDHYAWPKDGNEWTEMAQFSGTPYEKWKDSLAKTFLIPYLGEKKTVIEIGPGHGRWSEMIAGRVCGGGLYLVDISPSCLEYCRNKIIQYHVMPIRNDGKSLAGDNGLEEYRIHSDSVDFIWSFDTFVHIEEPEVRSYVKEFARALKHAGMGVIHHPGNPTPEQRASGCRSLMTSKKWTQILAENGLHLVRQTDSWDGGNVKLQSDMISVFVRP